MPDRRDILQVGSGLIAALLSARSALAATSETVQERKTYVLVHGAGHGGWCWRDVRNSLLDAGHRVFTPTLTGLGERIHLRNPEINLTTHVTDIVNVIEYEELEDVILVGHSYAGMVITGVADQLKDRLRHVVYLDAYIPKDGYAMIPEPRRIEAMKNFAIEGYLLQSFGAAKLGVPPSDVGTTAWVNRRVSDHLLATFAEPLHLKNGGAKGISKTFVRCTEPRFRKGDERAETIIAEDPREWRYLQIATGHDAMITAHEEVTQILLETI